MSVDYQELLDKYDKPYVPGEVRSPEYEKNLKRKQRLKSRLIKLDIILNEVKPLLLTESQKEHIAYLIRKHSNNFKKLHGNASEETIILAFIFYIKKTEDAAIKIDRYTVTKKYKLSHNAFETIICRLTKHCMEHESVKPVLTTKYDHEILLDSKGKMN